MTFDDLARIDHTTASSAPAPAADRINRRFGRPVTITVATGGEVLAAAVAMAVASVRGATVALLDTRPGHPCAEITGTPVAPLSMLTEQLQGWHSNPEAQMVPSANLVDVWGADQTSADQLVMAHAVLGRSYPVIVITGDTDETVGLGDVLIRHVRWTTASLASLTGLLHSQHLEGEPVTGRVVIAATDDQSEPGLEDQARRWLAAFPVCAIPSDPATVTPPLAWDALRPITRTAYTNLAATALDLIH